MAPRCIVAIPGPTMAGYADDAILGWHKSSLLRVLPLLTGVSSPCDEWTPQSGCAQDESSLSQAVAL